MENFTTRREGTAGGEKGIFQREKLRMTEGFTQIDHQDVLFSAEGAAGLFRWARVCRPFCLQHFMRGVLCSAAHLFQFLSLIYCNVGLCGGEPVPNWLTHLTRLEDETYPSIVRVQRILLNAKCHDGCSVSLEARAQSGGPPPALSCYHCSALCDTAHLSLCCAGSFFMLDCSSRTSRDCCA